MTDDYTMNSSGSELNDIPSCQTYPEFRNYREADFVDEYDSDSEDEEEEDEEEEEEDEEEEEEDEEEEEGKDSAMSALSSSVVTLIAAAAVGITGMINVSMSAEFQEVGFRDGTINYSVSVENMTDQESLSAILSNGDEIIYTEPLSDQNGDGVITGSIPLDADDMNARLDPQTGKVSLRLNLSGNVGLDVERKFDSYLLDVEQMESVFDSVSGECHCTEDGCYHFQMNFRDDKGLFDSFEARIEDSLGNCSECIFTEDLHGEQTIFVGNLQGTDGKLILTYLADGEPQTHQIDIRM